MIAFIDGDMIVYRVGFTTEDVDHEIACVRAYDFVQEILTATDAKSYKIFLTTPGDPKAFRFQVYPEYKANRKAPRPRWYAELRDYLVVEFGATVVDTLEADDWLAIEQCKRLYKEESVIVTNDKDLRMIPGTHYDPTKRTFHEVENMEGLYHFYKQLLTGDTADNIKGIPKIGPKKADGILAGCETELDMFNAVRDAYSNDVEMLMNGRVLWIWRTEDDDWKTHYDRLKQANTGR